MKLKNLLFFVEIKKFLKLIEEKNYSSYNKIKQKYLKQIYMI